MDIRDRNTAFAGVIGYRMAPVNLGVVTGTNSRLWGYVVSGSYFDVLGAHPTRGRFLSPADDVKRGGHPVAVISYKSWQTRFGGASDIIGKTIKLNSLPCTIVGVAAQGFQGTERFYAPEVFATTAMASQIELGSNYVDSRKTENTFILERLKPGVTVTQAKSNLDTMTAKLAKEWPAINEGMKLWWSLVGLASYFGAV